MVICERKKHKAQVELLQLRIPPPAEQNRISWNKISTRLPKKHWSIAYYSETPNQENTNHYPKPQILSIEFNKGLTYWHTQKKKENPRWLHSTVHIGMLYIGANMVESLSNSDLDTFKLYTEYWDFGF